MPINDQIADLVSNTSQLLDTVNVSRQSIDNAATLLATHESQSDPHEQYVQKVEGLEPVFINELGSLTNSVNESISTQVVNLRKFMRNSTDFSYGIREAVSALVEASAGRMGRSAFIIEIPEMEATWDGTTINIPAWAKFRLMGGVNLNCTSADKPVFWVRSDLQGYNPENQYLQAQHQLGELFDTRNGVLVLRDGNRTSGGCVIRVGSGDGFYGSNTQESTGIPYTILLGIGGISARGFDQSIQLTNKHTFCVTFHDFYTSGCNKNLVTSSATGEDFGELSRFERVFFANAYNNNVELNSAHQLSFLHSSLTTPQEGASHIVFNADHAHVLYTNGRFESGAAITNSTGNFPRSMLSMSNVDIIPTPKVGSGMVPHHLYKFFTGQRHLVRGSVVDFAMSSNTPYISTYAGADKYLLADPDVDIQLSVVSIKQSNSSEFKPIPIQSRNQFIRNPRNNVGVRGWINRNSTITTVGDAASTVTLGNNPLTTANGSATVFMTWNNHGKQTGDQIVVSGATDVNGLLASNINGLRTVTFVNANAVSFPAASGTANAATAGGGAAVTVGDPAISFSPTAGQQGQLFSPMQRVVAGRRYGADALLKLMSTPTPTTPFFVANLRIMWYGGAFNIPTRDNPFTTTNASNVVTFFWPAHGRVDGDTATISGAVDTRGILAADLNGNRVVTVVDDNNVTFVAGSSATSAGTGGGSDVRVSANNEFLGFSTLTPQGFYPSKTPSHYDVWMRHGGTGIVQSPPGAEFARIQLLTNSGHVGELRVADTMVALAEC